MGVTPVAPPQLLQIVVHNHARGGATGAALDAAMAAREADADILVYTEPGLDSGGQRSNCYRRTLGTDYKLTFSLVPGPRLRPSPISERRAGVVIGVARRHAAGGSHRELAVPLPLQGYAAHVRLQPPVGRPLEIIGTYVPPACEDGATRSHLRQHIAAACQRCAKEGTTLLVAGDMNATLVDSDRSSGTCRPTDTQYREWAESARLVPIAGRADDPSRPGHRQYTYRQQGADGPPVQSRLDDVLACLPTLPSPPASAHAWGPA